MEAHDACLETVVFSIMGAQPFSNQFLPSISVLRLSGISVLLLKWHDLGAGLLVFGIDTGRRRIQVALDAVFTSRVQGMDADQRVVVQDFRMVRGDESHPTHIGCQRISLIDSTRRGKAV